MKENLLVRCRRQKNYNMGLPFPILLFRKRSVQSNDTSRLLHNNDLKENWGGNRRWGIIMCGSVICFPISWQRRVTPYFTMPYNVSPCLIMSFPCYAFSKRSWGCLTEHHFALKFHLSLKERRQQFTEEI